MKQTLHYGKITWDHNDFDPKVPCRPVPIMAFQSVRINGVLKKPHFSDKVMLKLLKHKALIKISFTAAYKEWLIEHSWMDQDLGEGRSFLRWLQKYNKCIQWSAQDLKLHSYFQIKNAPKHLPGDELAQGLSFAIKPVEVDGRVVKLYLQDEAILNLLNMSYGEEHNFLDLIAEYVKLRFKWEKWQAPAVPFLEWVKSQAKRPVFTGGDLGFCPNLNS